MKTLFHNLLSTCVLSLLLFLGGCGVQHSGGLDAAKVDLSQAAFRLASVEDDSSYSGTVDVKAEAALALEEALRARGALGDGYVLHTVVSRFSPGDAALAEERSAGMNAAAFVTLECTVRDTRGNVVAHAESDRSVLISRFFGMPGDAFWKAAMHSAAEHIVDQLRCGRHDVEGAAVVTF